jgi:UDP-glucose:(heptosyl)LPS alpha-1,3-glucosyltransferase
VNRRRGTERAVAELVERLAREYHCEVHLYAQQVDDLDTTPFSNAASATPGCVVWHRIRRIPGPHLLQFVYWIMANRVARMWDGLAHGLVFDVVFSPGINALDADVVLVHAVFHRLRELQDSDCGNRGGLRGLHRSLYYGLLCSLEAKVYRQKSLRLAAVSPHTAKQLNEYFGCTDVRVIPNGVDVTHFSPVNRERLRADARRRLEYSNEEIVVLLVGNDFQNKGLPTLLESVKLCSDLPLRVRVVGEDMSGHGLESLAQAQVQGRVALSGETRDILSFYSVADIYAAPSLEDSFNLPALEAMACGLPVIVSKNTGISEYLRDGENGIVLRDASDPRELADALRRIARDRELAAALGAKATAAAAEFSWDRHAQAVLQLLRNGT